MNEKKVPVAPFLVELALEPYLRLLKWTMNINSSCVILLFSSPFFFLLYLRSSFNFITANKLDVKLTYLLHTLSWSPRSFTNSCLEIRDKRSARNLLTEDIGTKGLNYVLEILRIRLILLKRKHKKSSVWFLSEIIYTTNHNICFRLLNNIISSVDRC